MKKYNKDIPKWKSIIVHTGEFIVIYKLRDDEKLLYSMPRTKKRNLQLLQKMNSQPNPNVTPEENINDKNVNDAKDDLLTKYDDLSRESSIDENQQDIKKYPLPMVSIFADIQIENYNRDDSDWFLSQMDDTDEFFNLWS